VVVGGPAERSIDWKLYEREYAERIRYVGTSKNTTREKTQKADSPQTNEPSDRKYLRKETTE
jgi:hypothetical protein